MEEGAFQQSSKRKNERKQKKTQQNNNQNQQKVVRSNSNNLVVKGLQFDGDSVAEVCNSLLEHSVKITTARSKISRNSTYRTSI